MFTEDPLAIGSLSTISVADPGAAFFFNGYWDSSCLHGPSCLEYAQGGYVHIDVSGGEMDLTIVGKGLVVGPNNVFVQGISARAFSNPSMLSSSGQGYGGRGCFGAYIGFKTPSGHASDASL